MVYEFIKFMFSSGYDELMPTCFSKVTQKRMYYVHKYVCMMDYFLYTYIHTDCQTGGTYLDLEIFLSRS